MARILLFINGESQIVRIITLGDNPMRTIIITLLVLAMSASAALALPVVDINGTTYTSANSSQAYDFIHASNGSWDSGPNRINIVDYILKGWLHDGDHTYTLVNGTPNPNPTDTWFANGAVDIMMNEIAGYANTNTFGYYTIGAGNSAIRNQIFAGSDSAGATKAFTLSPAAEFGFYLGVPQSNNSIYYTEANRNVNNEIHAAIFQVDKSNTYILGFEDLRLTHTDADYQDMIVKVKIKQISEPSTMLLFGAGLAGFGLIRKRFKS